MINNTHPKARALRMGAALLLPVLLASCSPRLHGGATASPAASSATISEAWGIHPDGFSGRYSLDGVVVLSRHNIRSPLSGGGSVLSRITPHTWYSWSSKPGELSLKGAVLETQMGQFFRQWLVEEGLVGPYEVPGAGEVRFYSNSLQRTIATARYFAAGMFPMADIPVEHHMELGRMDPVFNPQITKATRAWRDSAYAQIARMAGGAGMEAVPWKVARELRLLQRTLDMDKGPAAANDTVSFRMDDTAISFEVGKEPAMKGGLKMATSASDAMLLQYYEDPDEKSAAFGHKLSFQDWRDISAVKDWYQVVLFSVPAVAVNVAHPLLGTILSELQVPGRKFTFLCGHDSNIGSVLPALGCEPYTAHDAIETGTPIGSKILFMKYRDKATGELWADVVLVYASAEQLRRAPQLGAACPPMHLRLRLAGLPTNADGLYSLSDLEGRIRSAYEAYDKL